MFKQLEKHWNKKAIYTFPKLHPKRDEELIDMLDDSFPRSINIDGYFDREESEPIPDWTTGRYEYEFVLDHEWSMDEDDDEPNLETAKKNIRKKLKSLKKQIVNGEDDYACIAGCGFATKAVADDGDYSRRSKDRDTLFCRVHLDESRKKYTLKKHLDELSIYKKMEYDSIKKFLKNPLPKTFVVEDPLDGPDIVFTLKCLKDN